MASEPEIWGQKVLTHSSGAWPAWHTPTGVLPVAISLNQVPSSLPHSAGNQLSGVPLTSASLILQVLLLSFALIVFPSISPFAHNKAETSSDFGPVRGECQPCAEHKSRPRTLPPDSRDPRWEDLFAVHAAGRQENQLSASMPQVPCLSDEVDSNVVSVSEEEWG